MKIIYNNQEFNIQKGQYWAHKSWAACAKVDYYMCVAVECIVKYLSKEEINFNTNLNLDKKPKDMIDIEMIDIHFYYVLDSTKTNTTLERFLLYFRPLTQKEIDELNIIAII